MFKNITLRQAQEYAQAIHKQWARLRGPYHSKECLIGALDGFYKGLGLPYAPQDGPYDFGTPEFDAYYLVKSWRLLTSITWKKLRMTAMTD